MSLVYMSQFTNGSYYTRAPGAPVHIDRTNLPPCSTVRRLAFIDCHNTVLDKDSVYISAILDDSRIEIDRLRMSRKS